MMLDVHEALEIILSECNAYGTETVLLQDCVGRFLGEDVKTDRDGPPFDRVAMDGIAVKLGNGDNVLRHSYKIQGIQAAGMPQETLRDERCCLEVMTGAILPSNTDTVLPYETVRIENSIAYPIESTVRKRHIHYQGADVTIGTTILTKGKRITAGDVGILATLGKWKVKVAKVPKVAVISTGNELVEVNQIPQRHQIRMSNVYVLQSALLQDGIKPAMYHLDDSLDDLIERLPSMIASYDVLVFSGGVSKGRYDHIPSALQAMGVKKYFHHVAQRPGKPFWFGKHPVAKTLVFALPGNPLSTFVGYHYYCSQWLYRSLGHPLQLPMKWLSEPFQPNKNLSLFIPVKQDLMTGDITPIFNNGSGDLFSLANTHGFVLIPRSEHETISQGPFPFVEVV